MKRKQQLEQRLREIKAETDAILKAAREDGERGLTEEEQAKINDLVDEGNRVKNELATLDRIDQFSQSVQESVGRNVPLQQPAGDRIDPVERQPDPMAGFRDAAEFSLSVREACRPGGTIDDRLRVLGAPTNFHNESGGPEGFLVPPQIRQEIWELTFADEGLLSMVDSEPSASNAVELLADESTPWGSSGVTASWRSEGQQMAASRTNVEPRSVRLNELYSFVLATDELLSDAPRLANRITRQAARAIRWKATEAIFRGSGVGQPLGFLNSASLVTVGKESNQSADTIVAENVLNMFSRMLPGSISRAVWLINSDCIPQLMTMEIGNQPVYFPPSVGLREAPGGVLLGRPVLLSEHCETLGDLGDILFIDPKGYYLPVKQGGVQFASSIHLYFDYGIQAFRWTFRIGGQPYLSAPVSPANGTNTKSHFVALAERAGV